MSVTEDLNVRLSFGKYNGERITRVPPGYLVYMVQNQTPLWEEAAMELERRGTIFPTLEVTGHALDRASQRLLGVWTGDRHGNEGLHSWLIRVATEALECGVEEGNRIVWKNIGFVFNLEYAAPVLKTVMNRRSVETD